MKTIKATFNPKRLETLREGMEAHIGKTFTFWAGFVLDDDEGPYGGQRVWSFAPEHDVELGENAGCWAPEEDLEPCEGET